jgi:SSS family solute:Na+ symporter
LVAGALLLGSIFSLDLNGALIAVTVVFVLYTLWGGQLSVIRTDTWQLLLFIFGLVAVLALALKSGLQSGDLMARIPGGHLGFPVAPGFGWYQVLLFYPLIIGLPYLVGPDIYSRVLCAEDEASAKRASLSAALLVIPVSFLLAGLGLLIRAQFPALPAESALPTALAELAPVGLKGIIVVGVLGAIMSSADTTLISAATILSLNVVGSGAGKDRTRQLRMTRVFVVLIGATAWGIATFQQGIIASLLLAYTVFVGGVALPTLASFWRERLGVTSLSAFWAIALGGATALAFEVGNGAFPRLVAGNRGLEALEVVLGPEYGSILPLVVSFMVLMGLGRILPERGRLEGAHDED